MENRINQVMTLANGEKYIILRQAIYEDDNYYVCAKVTEDEKHVTEEFELLHEYDLDGTMVVEPVIDEELAETIFEYVGLLED